MNANIAFMFIDNFTEFKRSLELRNWMAKAYETNMIVLVCEYVTMMDQKEFKLNIPQITSILKRLSENYIFEDIGLILKNYGNWGYRDNGDIVILDGGYIYPLTPMSRKAMSCPICKAPLQYDNRYVRLICQNSNCNARYSFLDVRRNMNTDIEDMEDQMLMKLTHLEYPDFEQILDSLGALDNADDSIFNSTSTDGVRIPLGAYYLGENYHSSEEAVESVKDLINQFKMEEESIVPEEKESPELPTYDPEVEEEEFNSRYQENFDIDTMNKLKGMILDDED